jgi:hypothetical protein
MKNEITTIQDNSLLFDATRFEHAQRVSKMLSSSTMVPQHFRDNIGNCVIALNYAHRAGIDPLMVMQKMGVIHGKPSIEAQLQIALFNKGGRFSTMKYKVSGTGDQRECVAVAKDLESGEIIEGPPVSIKMAKDEGWYGKNGSKWKTLPELMLRYRAASFFIRLYAPETTLGLHTPEELMDGGVIDVTPYADAEADAHANTQEIDIDSFPDEPPQETEPESAPDQDHVPNPGEMTEEEKAAIAEQEAAEAADAPY